VRLERVDVLPPGWLGKCHACHVGAAAATGEWILFTDADCWLKPDLLDRALRVARKEAADHITLTPGNAPPGLAARAWHVAFLMTLANWYSGVNRDRPKAFLGMGAFNLVRRDAFRRCGGYEALRLTVLDDVKLGLLLKRSGHRTRAFVGTGDIECLWGHTLRSMMRVMEKNYFAALDYRVSAAFAAGLGGPLLWLTAALGPFTGSLTGWASLIALFSLVIPAAVVVRRIGWSFTVAIATPVVFPILMASMLNSTIVTLRQGGVRWRDTFYSLAELRAGNVQ
jgi:cellulose synthase/poly-beta-1,6-N-acetylglucosamine synthase-like glycosyltransferase